MRRVVVGAGAIALVLGGVALLMGPDGRSSSEARASDDAGTADGPSVMAAASVPSKVIETKLLADSPGLESPRRVSLSKPERRPGESDRDFKGRMEWLERYEVFAARAHLTRAERERVLSLLADAQEQAVLYWEAIDDSVEDVRGTAADIPDFNELESSLREQVLGSLREFLTSDQVIEFRRRASLGSFLTYGILLPLDIEE